MAAISFETYPIEDLDRPLFIMAFKGLFDMGEAATGAVDWLSMIHQSKPAASIDPELLFDFQEVRPEVRIGANGIREIQWPANNVVWARTEPGNRDLVLLSGVEPNLRWRSFSETIHEIAGHAGIAQVVTLGASLATVPHTRAFPVIASTADEDLAEELNISLPTYEGPTGLIGSIHEHMNAKGISSVSLTVRIPHYVPGAPSPKGTSALLAALEQYLEVPTEHAGLADDIRDWESRVHRALEEDEEVKAYVTELETKSDEAPEVLLDSSGMTKEIEDFLRDRKLPNVEEPGTSGPTDPHPEVDG